jgi:hypothetical protein
MATVQPQACMATATLKVNYFILIHPLNLGMYDQDPYGDEIEGGEEDRNDGLNALVNSYFCITAIIIIEPTIRYWL